MQEIPTYRLIIAATIVFIVGLFIFTIIFRAYLTFQQLEQLVIETGDYEQDQLTLVILGSIPWALGGFYVSLLGVIIYFLLRGNKPSQQEMTRADFRKR
ncbi:MAG: hypothetical protein WC307_00920 [Candidatus Nanoarchaeia archaeon]|jgi:uncharacterized membrane protein YqhA